MLNESQIALLGWIFWGMGVCIIVVMGWRAVAAQHRLETKFETQLDAARRAIEAAERPPAGFLSTEGDALPTGTVVRHPAGPIPDRWGVLVALEDFPAGDQTVLREAAQRLEGGA